MGGRRKLLVVANRGPVSYGRSATGERVVLRGGGGLVTALRSLVAHHDVTWIASAMSEEDRAVAGEHDGDGFDETARDGSRVPDASRRARSERVRLVLQRRREPDALVPPALHVGTPVRAGPRSRAAPRVVQRLPPGQRGVRRRCRRGAGAPAGCRGVPARLPPLSRSQADPRAPPGRGDDALHPHPVAAVRLLDTCCRSTCAASCTKGCSRTTSSGSTPSGGSGTSCAHARTCSAPRSTTRREPSSTTAGARSSRAIRSGSTRWSSTS